MYIILSEYELLKFAIESGTIDITTLQAEYDMNERKKYLSEHEHKIWQGTNGSWYTYVSDSTKNKGRKLVRKNTRKEIEDAIYKHNYDAEHSLYISDVFEKWIAEKEHYEEVSSATLVRYRNDYKRFFTDAKISQISFSSITDIDIEHFIKDCIHDKQLTQKTYAMLRLLIIGIFRYGKSNKYTDLSITQFFSDLYLSKGIFAKKKKVVDSEEVYNNDEIKLLIGYLRQHPTKRNIGLLLQFQSGMRIGEVSALKPCEVNTRYIHVCRTEVKMLNKETGKTELVVQDNAKTDAGERTILLPSNAKETVLMALSYGGEEFLFEENGKRITTRRFGSALKNACKELDIPYRSTHKIRKTYASTLLKNGVKEDTVKEMLGHASITTTQNIYRHNTDTDDEKIVEINRAINW